MSYDPDTLDAAVAKAPVAGFAPINYGKMTIEPVLITWADHPTERKEDGKPKRIKIENPLPKGHVTADGETVEIIVRCDIQEFNPDLNFSYERRVQMKVSSDFEKTDWSEILLPSFVKSFGAKWAAALLRGAYVEITDVPNKKGAKGTQSGKVYTVPSVTHVYKNVDECRIAYNARYKRGDANVNGAVTFPEDVLAQVRNLVSATSVDQARTMLAAKPFGDYEAGALLKAVMPDVEIPF